MGFAIIIGLFSIILTSTNGLECGNASGLNTTELRVLLKTCIFKENLDTKQNKTENNDYNNEYDDSYFYDDFLGGNERNQTENDKETTTEEIFNHPGRCTYHCIFKKLNIIDQDGFPDHEKVSQNLKVEAKNDELKDFLQDSIDECFQVTQAEELDVCDFSYNFFKCLAEKARDNCSDWPLTDSLVYDLF
ncbi:odorant-binding protein 59a [Onthophagus taurus]|uniref:odorant-binding protein 59a n=1 Tax=Onthophagus taurus TaxID=166361 RepID=UPI000C1FF070|nr:general odorant-binding protein 71 [Onthophagus taurus]